MNARPHLGQRTLSGATALLLAVSAAVVGVTAHAADGDLGNIKTDRQGSITLHKHESGTQNSAGKVDGSNATAVGGVGVSGVTFTAYKITNLDLTTSAAWQKLHGLSVPVTACDGSTPRIPSLTFGQADPFPQTSSEGTTTKRDLDVAAYLICETNAPDTVKKKAAPFIVTLPQPGATAGSWVYDVSAFPKNTVVNDPVKSVTVTKFGIGADRTDERQVSFDIRVKIPNVAKNTAGNPQADEFFKYFIIGDSLADGYTNGQVAAVRLANGESDAGTDIPAQHYEADNNSAHRHWLSVSFLEGGRQNKTGLTYLRNNVGKYVVVTIRANVNKLTQDGKLPNTGYLMVDTVTTPQPVYETASMPYTRPSAPGGDPVMEPHEPAAVKTNKVVTVWGKVQFTKVSTEQPGTPLEGAEFEIYAASRNGEFCPQEPTGNAIMVNGQTRFRSNKQGVVEIPGLFVASAAATGQGEPPIDSPHKCYVLKEVVAPVGYVLPTNDDALTPVKVVPGSTATGNVPQIENTRVTVPELPLTGASGTVLATVVGTGMILAAAGAVLVRRRQQMRDTQM